MIEVKFVGTQEKQTKAQNSFIAFLMDDGLNYILEKMYIDGVRLEYVQIENKEITFKLKGDINAGSTSSQVEQERNTMAC